MRSLNRILLIGEVKEKMEQKVLKDNNIIQPIILKTVYSYTDKRGKKQTFTEDHYVLFWNKLANNVARFVSLGDVIFIEGRMQSRFWYEGEELRHEMNALAERYISLKQGSHSIYD